MAVFANDTLFDQALNYLANNGTRLDICSAEPTTYAEATSTYTLGNVTGLTSANYTGPANGDTSGRKITKDNTSGTASSSGTCTHAAITDGSSTLLLVTTITSQSVTSGNSFTVQPFDFEVQDAS